MVSFKLVLLLAINIYALLPGACPAKKVHTVIATITVTSSPTSSPTETVVTQSHPSDRGQQAPKTSAPDTLTTPPKIPTSKFSAVPSAAPNVGYMSVVDQWRAAMNLPRLSHDSHLESNALQTSQKSGGRNKHSMHDGTSAQVMGPGSPDGFEKVFVGGWLCEIPNLPGLGDVCGILGKGWNHLGQTGHAEILTSKSYSKIGCGLALGIWTCDLA